MLAERIGREKSIVIVGFQPDVVTQPDVAIVFHDKNSLIAHEWTALAKLSDLISSSILAAISPARYFHRRMWRLLEPGPTVCKKLKISSLIPCSAADVGIVLEFVW